ncbi:MAG: hypothetical protein AAF799_29120 [Myxococcota bacterium]
MTTQSPPRTQVPDHDRLPKGGSARAASRVEREDLVTFVNAAFSSTGQREFYGSADGQAISIEFLHEYIRGNYRRLYARSLAVGLNHYNTAKVIVNLLASSREVSGEAWREEGRLCSAALRRLPPPQAYRLFRTLVARRVNNRRTRAIVKQWLSERGDLNFDAVKYRTALRAAVRHCHMKLPAELGRFLFGERQGRKKGWAYEHSLLDAYRRAHYDTRAIYELPYTVAEGFAGTHGIDRVTFLKGIEPRMTKRERLRLQQSTAREGVEVEVDLDALPLTRLCSWVVTRSAEERRTRGPELHAALTRAAQRVVQQQRFSLGSVTAVLDNSYSMSGSSEKRRRPLAVTLAGHYLLRAAAQDYRAEWTHPPPLDPDLPDSSLHVVPQGSTDLASPLIRALRQRPSLLVVLSDGFDNDPPGAAGEVLRVFRQSLDPGGETVVVHANPVFDADDFSPRTLTPRIPTIGVRDAEDLPVMLEFARFAADDGALAGLQDFLHGRVQALVHDASGGRR